MIGRRQPPSYQGEVRGCRVLVVASDVERRRLLAKATLDQHDVVTSHDVFAGTALVATHPVDVVLIDAPRINEEELQEVDACCPGAQVLLLLDEDLGGETTHETVFHVMNRSTEPVDHVSKLVLRAGERAALVRQVRELRERLRQVQDTAEFVSASATMDGVLKLARAAAVLRCPVCLVGESGTGKELLARGIHRRGARASLPFVVFECAAVDEQYVDHELWGVQVTAAAGAGAAETEAAAAQASGGTLFLADVDRLSARHQARLSAWLERANQRATGASSGGSPARVVVSCCTEPKALVDAGKLRKDLYHQLLAMLIRVPPLRQRKDDIPVLVYHLLNRLTHGGDTRVRRVSAQALKLLRQYTWPGNVRELMQAITRALAACRADVLLPCDFAFLQQREAEYTVREASAVSETTAFDAALFDIPFQPAKQRLVKMFTTAYVQQVVARSAGNLSEAARQSGLDRSNFRRLVKATHM